MSSPVKKKKIDYPEETEGSRLAARIRQRAHFDEWQYGFHGAETRRFVSAYNRW
jgi:hypothetical protein